MKWYQSLIKRVLNGIILFLLPVMLLLFILGKAISIVQSSWAIGYALAALAVGIVLHYADWRIAFFVGILPAFVVLWIRRGVPESEMWEEHRRLALDSRRAIGEAHHEKTVGARADIAKLDEPRLVWEWLPNQGVLV